MDAHTHTNEGNALSNSKDGKEQGNLNVDNKAVVEMKTLRDGKIAKKVSLVGADRWLDQDMVRIKVVRDNNGKLGTRDGKQLKLWRKYSGLTFDELEDLVPMKDIAKTDLYWFASVYWLVVKKMTLNERFCGVRWRFEDLGLLFMMKRLEDANEGSVFSATMLCVALHGSPEEGLRPNNHLFQLTNGWIKSMRARGLIERLPGLKAWKGYKVAMFRLSASGRQLLVEVIDHFGQTHNDIRYWAKNDADIAYFRRFMARFCLGIRTTGVNQDDDGAFNEIVDLTRK